MYLRLLHFPLQGCDNSPWDRESWISKDGIIWSWYSFLKWACPSFDGLFHPYCASMKHPLLWHEQSEQLCSAANKCQAKSSPCTVRCWHLFVERGSDSETEVIGTETYWWIFFTCLFVCLPTSIFQLLHLRSSPAVLLSCCSRRAMCLGWSMVRYYGFKWSKLLKFYHISKDLRSLKGNQLIIW